MVRLGLDRTESEEELRQLTEDALRVSLRSWQGGIRERRAISDPEMIGLFRCSCRRLARSGRLDLSVMYVADRPVSFMWGAARWPLTTAAKLGFDPAYAEQSPGLVHMTKLIQDSIARGGLEIDFGHEFSEYKSRWGKRADPLYEGWWYPAGLPSLAYWGRRGFRTGRVLAGWLKAGGKRLKARFRNRSAAA